MKFIISMAFLLLSLSAQKNLTNVSLQLKWKQQFQFAGFIVAKEKGFFKEVGLEVTIKEYDSHTYDIQKVLNETIHFAVSDSALILESINGSPVVGLMPIYQKSPYILMSLKSSKINHIHDLNGKKIAIFKDLNGMAVKSILKAHHVNYTPIPTENKLHELKKGSVDSIIAYISNEPFLAKEMGMDITIIKPDDYGFERYGDILFTSTAMVRKHPEIVENMYQASKKGFEYAFSHIDEVVELIYNKYNTHHKSKDALRYEANILKNLSGFGKNFAHFTPEKVKSIAYIYSFTELGKHDLKNLETFIYKPKNKKELEFTEKEKAYLKNKKTITMCYPTEQIPFTMLLNGQPEGVSVDYLRLIEKKIGIKFDFKFTDTLTEQFVLAKKGVCEAVPLILTSPQTVPFLIATEPTGKDSLTLVTKNNEPYIFDMSKLKNKKIGINAQAVNVVEYLKKNYPDIHYLKINGIDLDKVVNNELYGFIGSSVQMNYLISTQYNNTLKVMKILENSELKGSIGVSVKEPMLLSILNKTILSLGSVNLEKIFNKWINIKYKEVIDYKLVYQILLATFIVFGIIFYWNRRLNREIQRRKAIQESLKESEEKFRTLFDIAPIMLDSFDKNGRCTLWNKECERVFGWSIDEINQYENTLALFYPDPKVQQEVRESFAIKSMNIFREWHPLTKSGKSLTTMWANIILPNGEAISVGLDITKQREAEQETENKTKQVEATKAQLEALNLELKNIVAEEVEKSRQKDIILQQQSKMASMGEMIENIAHQWRQPLAQINSSVLVIDSTMHKNGFHHEKIEKKLLEIESLTDYMSKTINDFQNFFNPNKKRENFYVYQAIKDSLLIVRGSFTAHYIDVVTDMDENLICNGYKNELQQVIVVILNNARDVLKNRKVPDPRVTISLHNMDQYFMLEICDNGKGIDPQLIDKIFDPYFTTKHKSQGTGLGLFISKMIIEDGLQGKLMVENSQDGACFKILLSKGEV